MNSIIIYSDQLAFNRYQFWFLAIKQTYSENSTDWDSVEIAMNEAFNNALLHGNKNNGLKKIKLSHEINSEKMLQFSVLDEGIGFDLKRTESFLANQKSDTEGGRGILFMKSLSEKFSYSINPSCVELCFPLSV